MDDICTSWLLINLFSPHSVGWFICDVKRSYPLYFNQSDLDVDISYSLSASHGYHYLLPTSFVTTCHIRPLQSTSILLCLLLLFTLQSKIQAHFVAFFLYCREPPPPGGLCIVLIFCLVPRSSLCCSCNGDPVAIFNPRYCTINTSTLTKVGTVIAIFNWAELFYLLSVFGVYQKD